MHMQFCSVKKELYRFKSGFVWRCFLIVQALHVNTCMYTCIFSATFVTSTFGIVLYLQLRRKWKWKVNDKSSNQHVAQQLTARHTQRNWLRTAACWLYVWVGPKSSACMTRTAFRVKEVCSSTGHGCCCCRLHWERVQTAWAVGSDDIRMKVGSHNLITGIDGNKCRSVTRTPLAADAMKITSYNAPSKLSDGLTYEQGKWAAMRGWFLQRYIVCSTTRWSCMCEMLFTGSCWRSNCK